MSNEKILEEGSVGKLLITADGPDKARERYVFTHCDLPVDDEQTAYEQQYQGQDIGYGFHVGEIVQPGVMCIDAGVPEIGVRGVKLRDLVVLARKCLYHAVSGDILLCVGVHARELFPEGSVLGRDRFLKSENDEEYQG